MADSLTNDEILKQAGDSILEDYKQMGKTYTPEQEDQFNKFIAGLVDAEPPTSEQIWQTMEIVMEAIRAKNKEKSLETIIIFILEFISACDQSSGAFQYVPMLIQAKDAIKAGLFAQAGELMVAFLTKCREAARSM
jgi:hypothetical protein